MTVPSKQIQKHISRAYPAIPQHDKEVIVAEAENSFREGRKVSLHVRKLVERHILELRTSFRKDLKSGLLWEEARQHLQPQVDEILCRWTGKSSRRISGRSDQEIRNILLDRYPRCPTEHIPHLLNRMRLSEKAPKALHLRIDVAVENFIRHMFTSYDIYLRTYGVERDLAREMVDHEVRVILGDWATSALASPEEPELSIDDFLRDVESPHGNSLD
ncbi:DUF2293 domain-containing protein [Henriciella sp.]|uniref:DUF2293 domain-containing protein n=1 Tax=Henriciella sp. TaxID=1968823 RepID=UPI002626DEC0|nr:DUF2293 domain-containing protein [Henriciella sp.]